MKFVLLLAFAFLTMSLNAQELQPNIDKLISQSKLFPLQKDSARPLLKPFVFNKQKAAPGIYSLPQDGMPCIVPDTQSLALMPNAAKVNTVPPANQIPNAIPNCKLLPKNTIISK